MEDIMAVPERSQKPDPLLVDDAVHEINQRWGEQHGEDIDPLDQALVRETAEAVLAPLWTEVERLRVAIERVGTRCRVTHGSTAKGTTCREVRDSAAHALATGEQPERGSRWGLDPGTDTRAWTERTARGEGLCLGCVLADALNAR